MRRVIAGKNKLSAPTIQASAIAFGNIERTSMTVRWTRGNGDGVIVFCRYGYSVPTGLVLNNGILDGVIYNASSVFGGSTIVYNQTTISVIYNGVGSNVDLTGLTSNSYYHFLIVEYNSITNPMYLRTTTCNGVRLTLR